MKMGSAGRALCAAFVLGAWMAPTWAAREFTPQAGLWMIPSENNGQPGRGFSLDVQGNTAFLQVFNYEKSGAATFHTAVGQLDDAASMTVPLLRFKGGRFFGGPPQDAVEDGSAGNVTVKFTDGLNGTVQFPEESEQPVARLLVDQKLPFWWTQPSDDPPVGEGGNIHFHWFATGPDGSRLTWTSSLEGYADGTLRLGASRGLYRGGTYLGGYYYYLKCTVDMSTQVVDCIPGDPPEIDLPASALPDIARVRFRMLGRDVVGVVQLQSNPSARLVLNGTTGESTTCKQPCNSPEQRSARAHVMSSLVTDRMAITGWVGGFDHIMLLPVSGAWVIEEENTGRPGRGVFLDVQDNTIVVQTSDYLADGQPSFHLGASTLTSSSTYAGDTTASMPLVRHAGGRHFGGPPQSGQPVGNAGTAAMAFPFTYKPADSSFAAGVITLPGEEHKTIRKLQFNPPEEDISHMLGEYFIRWNSVTRDQAGWVRLMRVNGRFAMNEDGTVQCYQDIPRQDPYSMRCALLDTPNLQQNWKGSADITIHPFHRDVSGGYPSFYVRTRDRFGNWLGLGPVRLPGLDIPAN